MIIDFHTHVGDLRRTPADAKVPVTWANLIERLDDEGIDQAVMLPSEPSPEACSGLAAVFGEGMGIREQVLEAKLYRHRVIAFTNLDPRWAGNSARADFSWLIRWSIDNGCRGVGEIVANVPFDDPRTINMFRQIGDAGMCAVFHGIGFGAGAYGLQDDPGAPRLETLLREAPSCTIVGHGQGFWAEMGSGLTPEEKMGYPQGPIVEEGALPRLMRAYPNLYCDVSAGSGYNALTRDRDYGLRFIDEFQDRIIFGTDVCFGDPEDRQPHLGFLRRMLAEGSISQGTFEKITWHNGARLLLPA